MTALIAGMIVGSVGGALWVILGIVWLILLITLGIMSIRRGHWVMFLIGLFFPVFWIIGALLPPRQRN